MLRIIVALIVIALVFVALCAPVPIAGGLLIVAVIVEMGYLASRPDRRW